LSYLFTPPQAITTHPALFQDMKMVYGAQSDLLNTLASAKSMELQYMLRSDVRGLLSQT
jgi:hypothetical protein